MIDAVVKAISVNAKCPLSDAHETFISSIYNKLEDSFISVAVKKGVADGIPSKIMDEVSVEAMLTEAGVNWTNARILFRHLKQFFGRSLFASEIASGLLWEQQLPTSGGP